MVRIRDRLISAMVVSGMFSGILPLALHGQAVTPKAPLYEEFLEEVNVSGQTWRGVMFGELEREIRPGRFTVWLPNESELGNARTLCVDILSLDGLYRARYTWKYEELEKLGFGKIHSLSIETRHEDRLQGMKAGELALRAVLNGDCDRDGSIVLLAGWQDNPNMSDSLEVAVLVNNPEGRAFVTRSGHKPSGCVNLDGATSSLVAYDKVCRFKVQKSMNSQPFTVERWDGLDRQDPVRLSLRWGGRP